MAPFEKNEKLIHETQAVIEYIKSDWTDSLGQQYVLWLEDTLQKITYIERRREIISLKAQKISLLCTDISSTEAEDKPKVLKKEF